MINKYQEGDKINNHLRPDGTLKGLGYLGIIKGKGKNKGSDITELSYTDTINGEEVVFPSVVPTLTKKELNYLIKGKKFEPGIPIADRIYDKAYEFAKNRISQGKPTFAEPHEEGRYLPNNIVSFGDGGSLNNNNMNNLRNQIQNIVNKYSRGGNIHYAQNGLVLNSKNFDSDWYGDYTDVPNFDYRDVNNTSKRWQYLASLYGMDLNGYDVNSQEGLNKVAGSLQRKGISDYSPVSKHYAMNMAPTRDGLRDLVKNGVFTAKELKDMGVKLDANGLPTLGVDEIKMSTNDKAKLVSSIQERLGKEEYVQHKDSYINRNFVDDKAYHRFFEMRDVEFDSQEELDDFVKERGFNTLEGGDGIYTTGKTGAYVKLRVKDPVAQPEEAKPNDVVSNEGALGKYENEKTNYSNPLPIMTPDQSNMAPSYFGTRLRGVSAPWNVANFVTPDASIREINRQSNTARDMMVASNPYTSASAVANIQAQENKNIADTIFQTELANQQAQNQTDAINEQRIMSTDVANNQESAAYENRSNVGLDNFNKEWMNYIDRRNKERKVNYNLQNNVNAINAVNPNYNIAPDGSIQQTGEDFKLIAGDNNQKYIVNRNGDVVSKVTEETKIGNKKTTVTTTDGKPAKSQAGGLINSSNLKEFLSKYKKG